MNKAFKVLWNQVRGSYVVASENQVTHGKPGKATKTIVAAAVAGLMAMGTSAFAATPLTNDSFGGEDGYDTTKFISANGEETVIQTNGDARKLISAILSGNFDSIRGALGTDGVNATLVGFAGGANFQDSQTKSTIDGVPLMVTIASFMLPELKDNESVQEVLSVLDKYSGQMSSFEDETNSATLSGSTSLHIGGNDSNPLMIGTVGADRLVNSVATYSIYRNKDDEPGETTITSPKDNAVVRNGDVNIYAESGNLIGLVGGSSSLNIGGVAVDVYAATHNTEGTVTHDAGVYLKFNGVKSSTTLNGNTNIELAGTTSAVGLFSGGSSIALGGVSESIVNGSTHLIINNNTKLVGYEGINAAVAGGGLSVALLGGESKTEITGDTLIDLKSGTSVGVLGGGLAVGAQTNGLASLTSPHEIELSEDGSFTAEIKVEFEDGLESKGGQATAEAQNINILAGSQASTLGILGSGLAVAYQYDNATKQSYAESTVKDVNIQIGDEANKDKPVFVDTQKKGEYFKTVKSLLETAMDLDADSLKDDSFEKNLQENLQTIADVKGVTVGAMGGGLALAWSRNTGDATSVPQAITSTENVTYDVWSGYNVALMGGGMALASGNEAKGTQTLAQSTVKSVTMNFNGGETIGVMGGGLAAFVGSEENNYGVGALATVDSVTINVGGGSVDGIVGGGLAIDDSNPKKGTDRVTVNNVDASVDTVTINGTEGTIERINFASFVGSENQAPNNPDGERPVIRDHLDAIAYAVDHQNVAIVGGGLASGIHDDAQAEGIAHVGTANINLGGNVVVGSEENRANIYGGGIAANGAKATVESANILIAENAKVYGDVYAGGIAQDGMYVGDPEYYNVSESQVKTAKITLVGGELHGNLYAGGLVSAAQDRDTVSSSYVDSATIILANGNAFKGEKIDGSGVTQSSALEFASDTFDMTGVAVSSFDTIKSTGATVGGLGYIFGEKEKTTVTGGSIDFAGILYTAGENTLAIGDDQTAGVASVAVKNLEPQIETVSLTRAGSQADFAFDVNNGLLSLNADSATAQKALATATSQAKAAAYVTGATDLTNIAVLVGNTEATEAGLHLGSDAMLVADAGSKTTEVMGTADTAQGTIHFVGVAEDGAKVTIAADDETATSVDNMLFKAVKNDNVYTFAQRTGDELAEVGLGDFDDPDFLADLSNHDTDGANYIAGFLDQSNTGVTNANRTQQLNAAVNLATAAGVQTAAIDSATMGLDAANKRASLIHEFADGGVLFAEASGRRTEMGGSADFGEIKAELGGVVVGGEYTTGDWTFGALANVGTGSVKGQGKNEGVDNDVDYYGGQLYAAKRFGQFNVVGQLGYLATSNEISHSTVAMNKADVDADVIMAGVRGEMRFDLTENSRLVPYVGVNYMRVGTDGYTTSQGVKVGSVDQNLFTVPVGVKYAGDMKTASGWTWTPSADVGYVAAFGDRDVDATTHVGAVGKTTMDVWAESVVRTSIGVKAVKDNFGVGVEAGGVMGSDDTTGVFGQIRVDYRF